MASIHLENTFDKEPLFEKGLPNTTKKDHIHHGYGVKSMMKIVSKYQGTMKMFTKDKLFILDILFCKDSTT
jgi:sensor histidine kinase regulating citrate/malate metabolism